MTNYELINTAINLLTGVGTVGAVIVALYLARKQNQPKIRIDNSLRRIYGVHGVSEKQIFVQVAATNIGVIREYITTFGYSVGFLKWKVVGVVNPSEHSFEKCKFPAFIEPGERVSDFIELESFDEIQAEVFTDFLREIPLPSRLKRKKAVLRLLMLTARCWVCPSRGDVVSELPDKRLREHIVKQFHSKL